jgi:hypothetical protein
VRAAGFPEGGNVELEEGEEQIVWDITVQGAEESKQKMEDVRVAAEVLREQVAALKEAPLDVGEMVKPPEEEPEDKKKPLLPTKKLKPEEAAAVAKVSGALSSGLVQGLKSGDVKGALSDMGAQLATEAATSVLGGVMQSALSFIPGIGPLLSGLFGGMFQSEGLVTRPTLAMVGEHEPEFIMTQERMRGLLSGGKPGYGFGPGDFGAPNVNVAAPAVNVEVTMNPGVDADIQTAYRARAGEARLSQLEG